MVNVARPSYVCVLSLPVRQKIKQIKVLFLTFEMMAIGQAILQSIKLNAK